MAFTTTVHAAEYYVATDGSDTNAGTSSAPFATIQKAADIMVAGDRCTIREGVYRETVTPANNGTADQPIIYKAYPNEEVVISGADVVSGWSQYSNSIYQAEMTWDLGDGFNQLFVNGAMLNRARWPNTGTDLLSPTTASATATSGTVTFSVSRPTDYWVGGTVYGLFGSKWTSQGATITASTATGALTVSDKTGPWYTGSGQAYITGILGELDSEGEWFLDGTTLYLWAPGSVDPSTVTVETKARKWCINLSGRSYVKFSDIDVFAGSINLNSDYCEISGCDAQYLSHFTKYTWGGQDAGGDRANGNNGVWINGDHNVISNCTFKYSAGSGILIYGGSNLVTRSVISEMDYSATYSCPMSIKGSTGGNQILFNTMYNTARDVLQLYGATADEIMYNNLYNAGRMCHDLGVTYQWGRDGQGTVIAYNWIHDNLAPGANPGIYNDNYCRNFIEHHNVIWNCEAGVRLNRPHDQLFVYNNTLFNCSDVNTHTYNQWPDHTPGWWIYGNANNHDLRNNLYLGSSPNSQLEDYASNDFRLKTGAAAIDAGVEVTPYTDGYQGAAPDLGAYEEGRSQWTAGHDGVVLQSLNAPNMITDPATDVLIDSAAINGSLTSAGAAPTVVWVFWGDEDAAQVQSNWDQSISFGTNSLPPTVAYSTNLTGLVPGTTYYYRFYATNSFGESWGAVKSFTPGFQNQTATFSVSTDLDIKPNGSKSTAATALIAGNEASGDRRVFMKFDLSGIQSNWTIHSATLRLYHKEGAGDTYGAASLFRITNEWTVASLTYAHPVGTNLGTIVGSSGPFNEFKEMDVTSILQEVQVDPDAHHGFSIRGTEGFTVTGKYFVSSEGPAGQRPELVVEYSVDDSDGDGYTNLQEFALGMDPTIWDAGARESHATVDDEGTQYFEYMHYRRTDYVALGLSYEILDSETLLDFGDSINAQDEFSVGPAVDGYEPIYNRYLLDGTPARFFQLRIKQN